MEDIQATFEIEEPELKMPQFEVQSENGQQRVRILDFVDPVIEDEQAKKQLALSKPMVRKAIILGDAAFNINEISAYVDAVVDGVNALDIKTADEKEVKKAQSDLNSVADDLNQARIMMQKVWMEPFDRHVKDPIDRQIQRIKDTKAPIAKILTDLKETQLKERQSFIAEAKAERFAKESEQVDKFIRTCTWFDDEKWLLKGTTPKKITEQIDQKTTQVVTELMALDVFSSDNPYAAQVQEKYRQTGNLAQCITYQTELEEQQRKYEAFQAEQKAKRAQEEAERLEKEEKDKADRERAMQNAPAENEPTANAQDQGGEIPQQATEDALQAQEQVIQDMPEVESKYNVVLNLLEITNSQASKIIAFFKENGIRYKMG